VAGQRHKNQISGPAADNGVLPSWRENAAGRGVLKFEAVNDAQRRHAPELGLFSSAREDDVIAVAETQRAHVGVVALRSQRRRLDPSGHLSFDFGDSKVLDVAIYDKDINLIVDEAADELSK
jgi:hypothetical protein